MRYYLSTYIGTGTDDDPYRPLGADDVDGWSSIDLRPPGSADGRCLFLAPSALPATSGRVSLGDDLDSLLATVRRAIENRLGVNLDGEDALRRVIFDLLYRHGNDARPDRWNQLKPEIDGWFRVWLGDLIHATPSIYSLTLTDTFDRANNTDINVGAPLTWGAGNAAYQIASNSATNLSTAGGTAGICRAESDLTANHYSQGTLLLNITANVAAGVYGRMVSGSLEGYRASVRQDSALYTLARTNSAGTATTLATKTTAVAPTSGKVMRLDCNGSTISSLLDGTDAQSVTDTTYPSNLRPGMYISASGSANRQGLTTWQAGDLDATATGNMFLMFS